MKRLQESSLVEFACSRHRARSRRRRIVIFRALVPRIVVALPIFAAIIGGIISANLGHVEAAQTIITPALSITLGPDDGHVFNITPGVFNSKTQNLSVATTSAGGYKITLETVGYENISTTDLVNAADTAERIKTLTAPQGDTNFNNAYGYNFTNTANPPATTTWHPAPETSQAIKLVETAAKNTTPDNYALTFGALTDMSIPAGTYQNVFNINIVTNISPYIIIYNSNTGTGNMPNQPIDPGVPTALDKNTFTKSNYTFMGWNTMADGSGTNYADEYNTVNGEIAGANPGGSINLYAQWGLTLEQAYANAGKTKQNGYFKLQDMTSEICAAADIIDEGSQMQAIDIRDNKIYWITKYRDGKCWMTQNLDLDLDSTKTYTPSDTDIPSDWVPSISTYPTDSNIWEWDDIPESYDPGDKIWNGAEAEYFSQYNYDNMPQGDNTHYHLGNLYNGNAATAMNSHSYDMSITNGASLGRSICPAGWTLPKDAGGPGSFGYLIDQYGYDYNNDTLVGHTSAPLYFTLTGVWSGGPLHNLAERGEYLTQIVDDIENNPPRFTMDLRSLVVSTKHNIHMSHTTFIDAASVRCVSRDTYTVKFDANSGGGSMDDQIMKSGVSEQLKAGTFTAPINKTFGGWNTASDGSGTSYADGATVMDLTGPNGEVTLYAVWVGSAELDTGSNINIKMKDVAGNRTGSTLNHTNTNIKAIVRANSLPANFVPSEANTISLTTSSEPVYIFFDEVDGTMYYYTKSNKIYLNANSGHFAHNLKGITDISGLSFLNASRVTSMNSMFELSSLANIDALSGWDTSSVTNMSQMFHGASSLADINGASGWVTSSVTNMSFMFYGASSLADINGASGWVTSSVTNMSGMFHGASSLADINGASGWNTSSVTNMSQMFYGASSLADINGASGWVTSSVTDMSQMFSGASSLTNINGASGWVTSSVTDMSHMFYGASSLADINALSEWNTSSVTSMSYMFYNSSSLADINGASGWNTSSVTNMSDMFRGASSLADINGASGWVTSSVTKMSSMFSGASSLADINALSEWNTSSVTSMSYMFSGASSLADINGASGWVTSSVTNMSGMFNGASSLTNINGASGWVTSSVTNMSDMFRGASSLADINALSEWNTSSVTSMSYMFYNSSSLADINGASGWNTSSVTDMSNMFRDASSLADINALSGWNTSSVTNMSQMFHGASSLADINGASGWVTSSVTNMSFMFYGASSLADINGASGWVTSSVTNMSGMFHGASSLADINGASGWVTSSVTNMSFMFYGASSLANISGAAGWVTSSLTNIAQMFGYVYNIDATILNNWDVSKILSKSGAFVCPVDKRPSWY